MPMLREKRKWRSHERKSTDAAHRGGVARSSVEVSVMEMERRGCIVRLSSGDQPETGGIFWLKRSHSVSQWLDNKSRMNREVHVWICESVGGRFPRATRLYVQFSAFQEYLDMISISFTH